MIIGIYRYPQTYRTDLVYGDYSDYTVEATPESVQEAIDELERLLIDLRELREELK